MTRLISRRISLLLPALTLAAGLAPKPAQAAWVHFDPSDPTKVPKLFSQTGFYSNMTTKAVTSEAVLFDVNSPLWSDNAHKFRWVLLKPGSAKIKFDPAKDYFDYPDGAVFVKLFQQDTVVGDSTTRIYWETRVLINKKVRDTISYDPPVQFVERDMWYPLSYKWKRDGSDAELVSENGELTSLNITVKGQKTFRKWAFPGVSNCYECHRKFKTGDTSALATGRTVLGFYAPQLNRATAGNASMNQIRTLFQKNILGWDKAAPTETDVAAMPKWARIEDTTASLDVRAKAYIASNCSGCHGERGFKTGALFHLPEDYNYDFFKMAGNKVTWSVDLRTIPSIHFEGMPTVMGPNGQEIATALVVPGHPELSTILFRMKQRNRKAPTEEDAFLRDIAQMPPLGVYEEDTVATRWLTKWIQEMPALGVRKSMQGALAKSQPRWVGGYLVLPAEFKGKAILHDLQGRRYEMVRVSGNTYRFPEAMPNGVYTLRVGAKAYTWVR